ncbi:hypothetical protein, partial [Streptomyces cinereoruber]|uniref:hypothetical protein n=1 Tax=Streptomyces cinereoruber TaxID=67260 RepID=UPI003635BB9D
MPERLRRTLVGVVAGVIRMAHPSLDGMALGKGDGVRAAVRCTAPPHQYVTGKKGHRGHTRELPAVVGAD